MLLDNFHARKLRQDESPSLFQHELKKVLKWAVPGIDTVTCNRLLIHRFLLGPANWNQSSVVSKWRNNGAGLSLGLSSIVDES